MSGTAWRPVRSSSAEGAPYRHLAVRIIDQAFRDLASPAGSATDRESARVFLAGSSMLYHWCEVADLDAKCLVARANTFLSSQGLYPHCPDPLAG